MSHHLGVGRVVGLLLLGALVASGSRLQAQDAGSLDRGIAPPTDRRDGDDQPRDRVDRSGLSRPELRAGAADPDTGKPIDPRIEALLKEWSDRTKEIKRLQGRHFRATRDFSWGTESLAEGQFYVETPDKGRIDVSPFSRNLPDKTIPRRSPSGRVVPLKTVRDTMHDRWVCDGKEIKVINDDRKEYDAVKIPPNQRGENIMDGPLPFLFGMPPEKAKARYEFEMLVGDPKHYAVRVRPKWKQDAVDWIQAELLLDRETCLPTQVHLHNAAQTSETVYFFTDLQVNRIRFFFWSNPFEPSLSSYKRSVHNNVSPPGQEGPMITGDKMPPPGNRMPSLIGMPWKPVKDKLESLGHHVKLERGDAAMAREQEFHVEEQQPPAHAPLAPNSDITLKLYVRMIQPASHSDDYRNQGDPSRTVNKQDGQ